MSPALDPFDILGLPARFDLAPADVRAAFLARSALLHPDAVGGDDADSAAAHLNQAKRTLDDPESRAEALLVRLGGPRKEQDRSLPPVFLQEMLEVREQIDEAIKDPEHVERWEQWAADRRRAHIAEVSRLFNAMQTPSPANDSTLRAIRMELNMWRYVERLIEQLADAQA